MQANLIALVVALSLAPATNAFQDPDHPYVAPGASDRRSPCPALNILANHGYINRSGSFITAESATVAQMQAFNFSRPVAAGPVPAALAHATTGVDGTFHLDDLARKPLDHDGSLSRGDLALGDNIHFNRTIWDSFVGRLPDEYVTWKQAAEAGAARLGDARRENPQFELDGAGVNATFEQMSGVLAAFGGSVEDGKARRDWINASFVEERLPWALGWRTSPVVLEAADFGPMARALRTFAPGGV
ncbi:putative sterigmatocystin biosynthesis peroxidase stcC [Colletotrichum trifolii]|uniref:Putative sterigmatocystin biosynthesis peroxidase stcC n=1 Tax=Colletotrichum trifolii TaxID=5466 RepID=A0A4R8S171_COLTR|nr:putative sterigmatocystin biosynthesis peroxidase stcC [Colletotrichum trifolii]